MNTIDTATYIQNLRKGDHISCIYRTEKELFSLLVPFYIAGLKQKNKCIYIFDEYTPDTVIRIFKDFGFDLSPYIEKKDFVFLTKEDLYLKGGMFNADTVIVQIKAVEQDALVQGYSALRVAGDASWLAKRTSLLSDFMKYESKINNVIQESAIIAVCQYKESLFDEHILIDVIRTHPSIYIHDRFVQSKYFAPSDEFIPIASHTSNAIDYPRMIASLFE